MGNMTKNKFRFWGLRDKKFVDPYTVKFRKDGRISDISVEISQSTGLFDCNGREIYEGDFIETEHGEIQLVQWLNYDNSQGFSINTDDWHIEIVGNIFETDFQIKYNFPTGWYILHKAGNSTFGSVASRIRNEYSLENLDNIEIEKRLDMLCGYKSGVTKEIILK